MGRSKFVNGFNKLEFNFGKVITSEGLSIPTYIYIYVYAQFPFKIYHISCSYWLRPLELHVGNYTPTFAKMKESALYGYIRST